MSSAIRLPKIVAGFVEPSLKPAHLLATEQRLLRRIEREPAFYIRGAWRQRGTAGELPEADLARLIGMELLRPGTREQPAVRLLGTSIPPTPRAVIEITERGRLFAATLRQVSQRRMQKLRAAARREPAR